MCGPVVCVGWLCVWAGYFSGFGLGVLGLRVLELVSLGCVCVGWVWLDRVFFGLCVFLCALGMGVRGLGVCSGWVCKECPSGLGGPGGPGGALQVPMCVIRFSLLSPFSAFLSSLLCFFISILLVSKRCSKVLMTRSSSLSSLGTSPALRRARLPGANLEPRQPFGVSVCFNIPLLDVRAVSHEK